MPISQNLIFANLFYSGSSAIVPILEDLLRTTGINVLNYGPESTQRLVDTPPDPIYFHWTHDAPEFFQPFFDKGEIRVAFLHRDPRDVFVSYLEDHIHRGIVKREDAQILARRAPYGNFANQIRSAVSWVKLAETQPIKVLRFDDLKRNTVDTTVDVLRFYGLDVNDALTAQVQDLYNTKHSFEASSKRERGSEGMIRTRYMIRKGISGEWRERFDKDAIVAWEECLGEEIRFLGY